MWPWHSPREMPVQLMNMQRDSVRPSLTAHTRHSLRTRMLILFTSESSVQLTTRSPSSCWPTTSTSCARFPSPSIRSTLPRYSRLLNRRNSSTKRRFSAVSSRSTTVCATFSSPAG
ncbi:hypothetical protein RvY_01152-2 [Ramazzottius varieornatus]|uniref:Uncharacterized protein n=1 Tax=Ramazzottius varieornatus TaxID=947166 RepID=A0A1D1UJ95_RAMVA|nr:hypothetical protein RvY_01152-2 [Ramazzottius varieornatus]